MPKQISRRGFFKAGAVAAAGLAVSSLPAPPLARASGDDGLCTVLDLSKCIGCEACVEACRETWQSTVPDPVKPIPKPFPSRVPIEDWSQRKDVQDRLTPYNFLYLEHLEVNHKGQSQELHVPRRCMHCLNPPCANLCPFGAGRVEKNGIVHIDQEVCLGGAKCKSVCPWHIPQRQSGVGIYLDILPNLAGNGVMFKCHRCLPLVKQGKLPRCIEVCPQKIQSIGPRSSQVAKAEELARQMAQADGAPAEKFGDYLYGMQENGGTQTIYVSPYPMSEVSQAIAQAHQAAGQGQGKGPGQAKQGGRRQGKGGRGLPHMNRVSDAMAHADNLALALAVAPVAGVAAGALKLWSRLGGGSNSEKGGDA